ncbi:mechanosensitive ion channel family protein [Synechococcus sp. RSCCF101]|uniref:mechanosensitive ion channel family protein n=1 Tax=Synechococcus sp. RSCCF101 TaxID=2511069 RepID=UPI001245C4C0|nr:mechanosensitive ion channel family protein [Synechococcus sp. RSCCF101]
MARGPDRFQLRRLALLLCGLLLAAASAVALDRAGAVAQSLPLPMADAGGGAGAEVRPWWDPGKAHRCGRLWCSSVVLPYVLRGPHADSIVVAVEGTLQDSQSDLARAAERRSDTVRFTFEAVVEQLRRWPQPQLLAAAEEADTAAGRSSTGLRFWWYRRPNPLHPLTPRLAVGVKNDSTVVFVVADPDLGLASRTLVTVTAPDATHAGLPLDQLAERWRERLEVNLSEALWGLSFDARFPAGRLLVMALPLLLGLGGVLLLGLLASRLRQLRGRVQQLRRSLDRTAREQALDRLQVGEAREASEAIEVNAADHAAGGGPVRSASRRVRLRRFLKGDRPRLVLLRRVSNLLDLALQLLTFLRISLMVAAVILALLVLPEARTLALVVVRQWLLVPVVWVAVVVAQVLLQLGIERQLARWLAEARLRDPESSRYAMRAQTYGRVLTGAVRPICLALGVYFTLVALQVDRTILAGAGVVAVAVGFLSRGLLEDMINGVLILSTDRFAIGDVVTIGSQGGFVEHMNLYMTHLRGLDGQLTTLPNGQIKVVENLTKDWSRVNFEVEVSSGTDLPRALAVIGGVAEALSRDPLWQERILEVPEVLGVDRLHHSGCLIRVWIKTAPLAQWLVGREFRLRVKQALDAAGIPLGIPRQDLSIQRHPLTTRP